MKIQDLPGYMPCPKPAKSPKKDRMQSANRAKLLQELAEELEMKEVYGCEVCYLEHDQGKRSAPKQGCNVIDPAHRHEREDYYLQPKMLWTKNQVLMCGRAHHVELDQNKAYREEVFQKLRGDDLLAINQ